MGLIMSDKINMSIRVNILIWNILLKKVKGTIMKIHKRLSLSLILIIILFSREAMGGNCSECSTHTFVIGNEGWAFNIDSIIRCGNYRSKEDCNIARNKAISSACPIGEATSVCPGCSDQNAKYCDVSSIR